MTDILDRANKALEGVTPGPWGIEWYICRANREDVEYEQTRKLKKGESKRALSVGDELWRKPQVIGPVNIDHDHWSGYSFDCLEEDARFIAEARELVPALVSEIERLRARVKDLEAAQELNTAFGVALNYFLLRDPDKPTNWMYSRDRAEALARAIIDKEVGK